MRQIWFAFLIALSFIMMGCGSSQIDPAATEVAAVTQTTTAQTAAAPTATATAEPTATPTTTPIPTDTATPTLTPMPTATETPSPTPTPMGGGNGIITFAINPEFNPEFEIPTNGLNGIWSVRSDGSELTPVLSRAELQELLGDTYDRFVDYIENNDQGYLWTGSALHIVDEDWQIIRTMDTQDLNFVDFSPDGSKALFTAPDGQFHFIPVDGGEPIVVSAGADRFNSYYSADGTSIYYPRGQGREDWIMNVDGSDRRLLTLEALNEYSPHAGKPFGVGVISISWSPSMDEFGVSPDHSRVAFTWGDLLFVAGAEDVELANPQFVARLPQRSDAELAESAMWYYYADSIYWSANNEHVAVVIRDCVQTIDNDDLCETSVATVRVADGTLVSHIPLNVGASSVCGFTPDSSQLVFIVNRYVADDTKEGIYLVDFTTEAWSMIADLTEILPPEEQSISCYYGLNWGQDNN